MPKITLTVSVDGTGSVRWLTGSISAYTSIACELAGRYSEQLDFFVEMPQTSTTFATSSLPTAAYGVKPSFHHLYHGRLVEGADSAGVAS